MPLQQSELTKSFLDAVYSNIQYKQKALLGKFETLRDTAELKQFQNRGYCNFQDSMALEESTPMYKSYRQENSYEDDEPSDEDLDASEGSGTPVPPQARIDTLGWLAVHVPTLVQYLYKNKNKLPLDAPPPEIPDSYSTAYTKHSLTVFEATVQKHLWDCLPPAAALPCERLDDLLRPLAGAVQVLPAEWVVARYTPLRTWDARRQQWITPHKDIFSRAARTVSHRTRGYLPEYVQLLLLALQRSRGNTDGFTKWGLAWIPEGLYFHHRRALYTAKSLTDTREQFPETSEVYFTRWEDPAYHLEASRFIDLPRVSTISASCVMFDDLEVQLTPYSRAGSYTMSSLNGYRDSWDSENARVFSVKPHKADTLHRYLERLEEIDQADNIQHLLRPGYRKKIHGLSPNSARTPRGMHLAKTLAKGSDATPLVTPGEESPAKPFTVTLNTFELGWMPADMYADPDADTSESSPWSDPYYRTMRMSIAKDGAFYMALPNDIAGFFPELINPQIYMLDPRKEIEIELGNAKFKRYEVQFTEPLTGVRYDYTRVSRLKPGTYGKRYLTKLLRAGKAGDAEQGLQPVAEERLLYLHMDMFKPGGEFWAVLDVFKNATLHATTRPVGENAKRIKECSGMLGAFARFCNWLFTPDHYIDPGSISVNPYENDDNDTRKPQEVPVGDELRFLTAPDSPCPVKALTAIDRMQFLYDKAECLAAPRATEQGPGLNGRRAPRLNQYDRWVLWYAANIELPRLDVRLSNSKYAEYMCRRWMPWRRPEGLMKHLIAPAYSLTPVSRREDVHDVEALLQHAESVCGPSYTVYP